MIALDINVVVRLLVDDHPEQTRRARRLLEARPVIILPTVLLEAEWVLRGAYRLVPGGMSGASTLPMLSTLRLRGRQRPWRPSMRDWQGGRHG